MSQLKDYVDENLSKGFIRVSSSPAAASIFFVRVPGKKPRPCVDYQGLNSMTVRDSYPIPILGQLLNQLQGCKFFTKIDLKAAFNLLRVAEGDEWKTAFRTPWGLFEYLVMPFGLSNAPACFQRFIQHVLREIIGSSLLPNSVLSTLTTKFIDRFSEVLAPLTELTKNGVNVDQGLQTKECLSSFSHLKSCFTRAPLLQHFDFAKKRVLFLDSSKYALAAVLCQPGKDGVLRPVSFLSRKLTPHESIWQVHDQELFAVVHAFQEWRAWLIDTTEPVLVMSDHANLRYFMDSQKLSNRQARWAAFLVSFHFTIQHVSGKSNLADPATRRPDFVSGDESNEQHQTLLSRDESGLRLTDSLLDATDELGIADIVVSDTPQGSTSLVSDSPAPSYSAIDLTDPVFCQPTHQLKQRLTEAYRQEPPVADDDDESPSVFEHGFWWLKDRIFVPPGLRPFILQSFHDDISAGHVGSLKTLQNITRSLTWPGIRKDVIQYTKACLSCQRAKHSNQGPPGRVLAGQYVSLGQIYWSCVTRYFCESDSRSYTTETIDQATPHTRDQGSSTRLALIPSTLHESQENLNVIENIDTTSSNISNNRKRQKTSEVWEYFTIEVLEGSDDAKAACNYCGAKFVARNTDGTNHLWRHIKRCPSSPVFQAQIQATLGPGFVQNSSWTFSQETSRELLARMIIVHEYPFRITEHPHFRAFVHSLQPRFKMIGRHTVRDNCIKIYNEMKLKLMEEMSNIQRVALTTDLWTSSDQTAYMVVTVHYINEKWELIKRIIGFKPLASPHDGPAISERISQTLLEWNLMEKCTFMTLDNASSNNAAVGKVQRLVDDRCPGGLDANGKFFHVRCAAHVINLVVKDGFQCINEGLAKLRSSVKYFRLSSGRREAFDEAVRRCRITSEQQPTTDVATRWNSMFLTINSSLPFKRAFENLSLIDSNYKDCPTQDQWFELLQMKTFLSIFHEATEDLLGTKYPTSILLFKRMIKLRKNIDLAQENNTIGIAALPMREKFNKYWEKMERFAQLAIIFDPRYKLDYLRYYFSSELKLSRSSTDSHVSQIKECLYDYYGFYAPQPNTDNAASTNKNNPTDEDDEDHGFKSFLASTKGSTKGSSPTAELDLYLQEATIQVPKKKNINLLDWWKANEGRFPHLSQMAKTILMVPMTSVASESAFSTGGRVLDDYRSQLNPATVEALICAQDWLRVGIVNQISDYDEQ
ncbi:hypothetical protein MJO29_011127 [Puccinia striiformis f. sp. tritici]|nr:hypothetical protein MJO29_011127 [Puccinia striiformis f. sp. tritici]